MRVVHGVRNQHATQLLLPLAHLINEVLREGAIKIAVNLRHRNFHLLRKGSLFLDERLVVAGAPHQTRLRA